MDKKTKRGVIIIVLAVVSAITLLLIGKKKGPFKERNPYGDEEVQEFGDIVEEEVDEFEGAGDINEDQIIDKNKITYLRRDIPTLNTSMLIPQGWDIVERDHTILIRPNEESELGKLQVTMYIEDSYGKRKPDELLEFFEKYKTTGHTFYNDNFKMIPSDMDVFKVETIYDKDTKAYIHKGREEEFEQLPEIPKGLNEEDFRVQDRFAGILEEAVVSMRDIDNYAVRGDVFTTFFHTLTGNNKSLLLTFTAPKNFKEQMDEIARVMISSIQDKIYVPANKSDAKAVSVEKEISGVSFLVPESFINEVHTDVSYNVKAYNSIFDKSFGMEFFIKHVDNNDIDAHRLDISSPEIKEKIEEEVEKFLYDDDRTVHGEVKHPIFEIITTGHNKRIYNNIEGIEYNYFFAPNHIAYKYKNAKKRTPINVMATLIPNKDNYILALMTYENSNYELAKIYNEAILRSIKFKN